MNFDGLAAVCAEQAGLSRARAAEVLRAAFAQIVESTDRGEDVRICRFGVFYGHVSKAGKRYSPVKKQWIDGVEIKAVKLRSVRRRGAGGDQG